MEFNHRSPELETYEIEHKIFCDTYKDAVDRKVNDFLSEFGKRRRLVYSRYYTEQNPDPWRSWETFHYVHLTYQRPIVYFPD